MAASCVKLSYEIRNLGIVCDRNGSNGNSLIELISSRSQMRTVVYSVIRNIVCGTTAAKLASSDPSSETHIYPKEGE